MRCVFTIISVINYIYYTYQYNRKDYVKKYHSKAAYIFFRIHN